MELILVKPRVKSLEYDDVKNVERFEISPLEAGQAISVFGTALRTTLMSNVPGYAVTNFAIGSRKKVKVGKTEVWEDDFDMKPHIFDTVSGVTPNVTQIFLALKDASFRLIGMKEAEVTVTKVGPCTITLKDFEREGIKVLNPEHEILAVVDDKTEVTLSIKIREGRGYKKQSTFDEEGWLSIDAKFSPIVRVAIDSENMRVNGEEGFQKLLLTIETNGRLTPKESLDTAIRIIQEGYNILREGAIDVIENESIYFDVQEEEVKHVTYKNIDELGLSVRAYNALKTYGIHNTGDFERYTEKQIRDIDNVGRQTFEEIKRKLAEHNIELKKAPKKSS